MFDPTSKAMEKDDEPPRRSVRWDEKSGVFVVSGLVRGSNGVPFTEIVAAGSLYAAEVKAKDIAAKRAHEIDGAVSRVTDILEVSAQRLRALAAVAEREDGPRRRTAVYYTSGCMDSNKGGDPSKTVHSDIFSAKSHEEAVGFAIRQLEYTALKSDLRTPKFACDVRILSRERLLQLAKRAGRRDHRWSWTID